jgi:L-fucose mutarotase
MLKRIPPLISPELLLVLAQMGHGDELVIADANFPATSMAHRLVRADGVGAVALLEAVLTLLPIDTFVNEPAHVMRRVDQPEAPAPIWTDFQKALDSSEGRHVSMGQLPRHDFYARAQTAFAIVATGETALYGNIIIAKGVIAPK